MRRPLPILAALLAGCAAYSQVVTAKPPSGGPVPARLFISPMGEPFRSDRAGDPEAAWFDGADTDHDGRLSLAEFQADAQRWFLRADRGHDGEIDPDDIDYYENELVPEIRVADESRGGGNQERSASPGGGGRHGGGGRGGGGGMGGRGMGGGQGGQGGGQGGGGQSGEDAKRPAVASQARRGAARYSYLDFPEPLTAADSNLNRGIDQREMAHAAAERFATLDRNGDGYLERRELPRVDTRTSGKVPPRGGGVRRPPPTRREDEDE